MVEQSATWWVCPLDGQKIIKRCPGCEIKRHFVSSGAFRINAQKKTIDVWHIYKCEHCKQTWNIEILSRVNVNSIDCDLYDKFKNNDGEESLRRTFDYGHLKLQSVLRNKLRASSISISFDVYPAIQRGYQG